MRLPAHARGLCKNCYSRELYAEKRARAGATVKVKPFGVADLGECEVTPDCFTCPLPVCKYDRGGQAALEMWKRGQERNG